jgi:hypothetical protein
MPSGKEGALRKGRVRIVVHKPIPTKGRTADQVTALPSAHQCFTVAADCAHHQQHTLTPSRPLMCTCMPPQVCEEARNVIASALPPEMVGAANIMAPDES